jgi:uncharacterized protein (TIGR04255 family)
MSEEEVGVAGASSETKPLAGLPGADRTLLARAPLELAIVEVRFSGATELPADAGLRVRDRLAEAGLALTRLEPRQTQKINLVPGAPPSIEMGTSGWMLANSDGTVQATVLPESAVFQTATYHRWSLTMRPSVEAVLTAVGDLISPAVSLRIGLRYVNRFVDAAARSVSAWDGRINERFLGPACHPDLGQLVRGCQQQVDLSFSDTQGALLRHGPFVDEGAGRSVSYLLDIDCYDTTPSDFVVAELVERAEVLNRTAASLFQAVITEEYRRALQDGSESEDLAEVNL